MISLCRYLFPGLIGHIPGDQKAQAALDLEPARHLSSLITASAIQVHMPALNCPADILSQAQT